MNSTHFIVTDELSPYYHDIDGVYVDGKEYKSVAECVEMNDLSYLYPALLAKYTQHVFYQKKLLSKNGMLKIDNPTKDWEFHYPNVVKDVYDQLKPYTDEQISGIMGRDLMSRELLDYRIRYFKSSQPFVGKDQALFLSQVWCNKSQYQCQYDKKIEKLLQAYNCNI